MNNDNTDMRRKFGKHPFSTYSKTLKIHAFDVFSTICLSNEVRTEKHLAESALLHTC